MKEYFSKNKIHTSHSGEDQDFLTDNFYEKYKENTTVYIGEQWDEVNVSIFLKNDIRNENGKFFRNL